MKYNITARSFLFFVLAIIGVPGFVGCNSGGQSAKLQQYYAHGEMLYAQHCSNCHQKDGTGLGLLYPPLNASDFMDLHPDKTICMIRNGMSGELIVNGKKFNHEMPGLPALTELEIAEITTYIYNSWDRQHGLVDVKEVTKVITSCQ